MAHSGRRDLHHRGHNAATHGPPPCGPVLGWSARRPSRRSSHRSHWSIAPTGASLPPEHRSHWSTTPTGAPLPPEPRARLAPWCVASADHGRSTRRTSGVYRSCPPLTRRPCGVRSCVRMAWSLDKPARHRHAQESLSRPLPRSAAPSSAKKSPSHSSESRAYVYWSP